MGDIKLRINEILSEIILVENMELLNENTDLINDFMADSLLLISIIVEIESAFDITIPDEELLTENIRKYQWLCAETEKLLNERKDSDKDSE